MLDLILTVPGGTHRVQTEATIDDVIGGLNESAWVSFNKNTLCVRSLSVSSIQVADERPKPEPTQIVVDGRTLHAATKTVLKAAQA